MDILWRPISIRKFINHASLNILLSVYFTFEEREDASLIACKFISLFLKLGRLSTACAYHVLVSVNFLHSFVG